MNKKALSFIGFLVPFVYLVICLYLRFAITNGYMGKFASEEARNIANALFVPFLLLGVFLIFISLCYMMINKNYTKIRMFIILILMVLFNTVGLAFVNESIIYNEGYFLLVSLFLLARELLIFTLVYLMLWFAKNREQSSY